MVAQFLINAFSLGSFYALTTLGFALIFGVTHAFNLAHGEMVLLSGYLAYFLGKLLHIPFLLTLPICMLVLMGVAVVLRRALNHAGEPFELNSLVLTFGVALLAQNVILMLFSADYRIIRPSSPPIELPSWYVTISQAQFTLIVLSSAATVLLYLLWRKTFLGKALRATIQDREAAGLAGINVNRMTLYAFILGGALIGLAGPLYAQTAYLHPFSGMEATLTAVIITIFAGVGRIRGILIGGWILGATEALAVLSLGSSWRELVSAVILIAVLKLRPEGILSGRPLPA